GVATAADGVEREPRLSEGGSVVVAAQLAVALVDGHRGVVEGADVGRVRAGLLRGERPSLVRVRVAIVRCAAGDGAGVRVSRVSANGRVEEDLAAEGRAAQRLD
ncbi:MAG: hypothetical protein ACK56I_23460, partial [bacterium]